MKNYLLSCAIIFVAVFYSCDIDKVKDGEMPDVDLSVDTGELPEYNIDWADVDFSTTTKTVKVPKLVVVMEEMEVDVPVIDVDVPGDTNEKVERLIKVEADIKAYEHDLNIREIYIAEEDIYVVSELNKTTKTLPTKDIMRVSDQVIVKVPERDVKHYVIGYKPKAETHAQYNYIDSKSDINSLLSNAKLVYNQSK